MGIHLVVSFLLVGLLVTRDAVGKDPAKPRGTEIPAEQVELARSFVQNLAQGRLLVQQRSLPPEDDNANDYVDSLLVNLNKYLSTHDPLKVENLGEVKWLKVWGLNTISRTGKATMDYVNDVMLFEVNFGFEKVNAEAAFEKQILFLWATGKLKASIKNIKLYAKLKVGFDDAVRPKLEEFRVTDWGEVRVTIVDGNWLGTVASWFPGIITSVLKSHLPDMVKKGLDKVLANVNFKFPM